jgi:4-hydroxybenzoate polyprenyltransferase
MTSDDNQTVRDAVRGHWADRLIPVPLRPYARLARLDRPIGWWLLMWPCWWSAALAAGHAGWAVPNLYHLVVFMVGAVAMRGAGCTYNDIIDRDLDAQVARTRSRPIPSGQVTVRQAAIFLVIQALIGLVMLLQFNSFTIFLGLASLPIIAVYPMMKRITDWPQVVLGLAFSWGALIGWAAVFGRLDVAPLLLYAGGILWTIGYDTIYAHQDREDDAIIGVRSTARLFGSATKPLLTSFFIATIALFGAAFVAAGTGWPAFVGLAAGATHLAWQVVTLDANDPQGCLRRFRSNRDFGWIVFIGLVADSILRSLW